MKKSICSLCGQTFEMGVNGTVEGCDKCLNVTRDKNGYFWMPNEEQQNYQDLATGEVITVKRSEAFPK